MLVLLVAGMALLLWLTGCSTVRALAGGFASVLPEPKPVALAPATASASVPRAAAPVLTLPEAKITQSENPAAPSGQQLTFERETSVTVPTDSEVRTETTKPDGGRIVVVETFPAGTTKTERVKQGVTQNLGAAQKDTAREVAAKLSSYKGVQWVGVAALGLAAAMFHPVVRTVLGGGKSTQLAVMAIGIVLVFGPSLVVGNEKWLLVGALGFGAWHWFTARSSYIEGKLDADRNGIPDEEERKR